MSISLRGKLWDGLIQVCMCEAGDCRAVGDAMFEGDARVAV